MCFINLSVIISAMCTHAHDIITCMHLYLIRALFMLVHASFVNAIGHFLKGLPPLELKLEQQKMGKSCTSKKSEENTIMSYLR